MSSVSPGGSAERFRRCARPLRRPVRAVRRGTGGVRPCGRMCARGRRVALRLRTQRLLRSAGETVCGLAAAHARKRAARGLGLRGARANRRQCHGDERGRAGAVSREPVRGRYQRIQRDDLSVQDRWACCKAIRLKQCNSGSMGELVSACHYAYGIMASGQRDSRAPPYPTFLTQVRCGGA